MKKIVLIDCGYHNGEFSALFYKTLNKNNENKIFYGFEANPFLYKKYKNKNSYVQVFNKAVWIEDTIKNFYLVEETRGKENVESGASSLSEKKNKWNIDSKVHTKIATIQVNTVDLATFIENNTSLNDDITLKIDIEGSEYQVIQHLIDRGTIKRIQKLFVEFHDKIGEDKSDIINKLKTLNVNFEEQIYGNKPRAVSGKKITWRSLGKHY